MVAFSMPHQVFCLELVMGEKPLGLIKPQRATFSKLRLVNMRLLWSYLREAGISEARVNFDGFALARPFKYFLPAGVPA